MTEEKRALKMKDMMEMMAEFMKNNGPLECSSDDGSAVVRGSPRRAEATDVRGDIAEDIAAVRGAREGLNPLHDNFLPMLPSLEMGVYILSLRWGLDMICLYLVFLSNTSLSHYLGIRIPTSMSGPEMPGTTRKE